MEIGFAGLPVAGSFTDVSAQRRSNISQCAAQLLTSMVERCNAKGANIGRETPVSPTPGPAANAVEQPAAAAVLSSESPTPSN